MKRKTKKIFKAFLAALATLFLLGIGGLWRLSIAPLKITKDARVVSYIPKSIQFEELYLRAGPFYTIPELELTDVFFKHASISIRAPKLHATWRLSNLLRGDINISSVRIEGPKVRVHLTKEKIGQKQEALAQDEESKEENLAATVKGIFGKIPVKYLELKNARLSIHRGQDAYRFSNVNLYALQLSRVINFQARGFFSDTHHKPFFFSLKSKLEKESLDLSGQVDVRKVKLAELALPEGIKKKLSFFKHPISISFLYNFYPKTTDFYLNGKVQFFFPEEKPEAFYLKAEKKKEGQVKLHLSTPKIQRKNLENIWYPHEDKIRAWVLKSVLGGWVEGFDLEVHLEKRAQGYALSDVRGKMDLVGVALKYMKDLPAVRRIYGSVHFNKESLWGIVHRGRFKNMHFSQVELKISGFDAPQMHFDGGVHFAGPLRDLVSYLQDGFLKKHIPQEMKVNKGKVKGSFHLSVPLTKDPKTSNIIFEVAADLKGGAFSFMHQGQRLNLKKTAFDFKKTHEEMYLKGTGDVDGFKSQFLIEESYRENARVVNKKKLKGAGNIKGLWEMLPAPLKAQIRTGQGGQVVLSFYSERDKGDIEKIEVDLDLKDTNLYLPLFNWKKTKGTPGKFELDLETEGDIIRAFKKLSFVSPGMEVIGKAQFEEGGKISGISLAPFIVNGAQGEARADLRDGIWNIFVRVPFLNFNPLLASLRKSHTQKTDKPSSFSLNLDCQIENLFLKKEHGFKDVRVRMKFREGDCHYMNLKGSDHGEKLSVRYEPHGENMVLEVDVPKLETILDGLDVTPNIRAKNIQIQAKKPLKNMEHPLKGKLFVESIHVLKAPVFAKLLRLISIEGLLQSLAGEGLVFGDNYAKFEYKNQNIALRRAYMMNSSIGITAKGYIHLGKKNIDIEGVLVPANFINQLLGKIPLIGQLLTGGKDQGLFSVSYSAKGNLKDPNISSNPLGVIAPNFIKGLFSKHEKPSLTDSGKDATKL